MLHFTTLGSLALTDDEGVLVGAAAQQSRLLLLALLAVSGPAGMSRDRLLALLWPESDTERARGSLKQALYALRRDTREPELVAGTRTLQLNTAVVASDVDAFTSALAKGRLDDAVALYGGPFLDGVFFRDEAELERVVDGERDRLRTAFRGALRELARRSDSAEQHAMSAMWWQRLVAEEPVSASSTLGLMGALARTGDVMGVQGAFRRYERALREQLDESPDALVVDLARELSVRAANTMATDAAVPERSPTSANAPTHSRPAGGPSTVVAPPPPVRAASRRRSSPLRAVGAMTVAVAGAALVLASRPPIPRDGHRVELVIDDALPTSASVIPRNFSESLAHRLSESTIATSIAGGADGFLSQVTERWSRRAPAELRVSIGQSTMDGVARIETRVTRTDDDGVVWRASVRADSVAAVSTLIERVVTAVAVRLDPWMAGSLPLGSEPSTLASLLAFHRGLQRLVGNEDFRGARDAFLAAQGADSSFTMAALYAYFAARSAGDSTAPSILSALRGRTLRPLDEQLLEALPSLEARNPSLTVERFQRVAAIAPSSEWGWVLAKASYSSGRPVAAARELEQLGATRSWLLYWPQYWSVLASSLHYAGEYERELEAARRAKQLLPSQRLGNQCAVKALAALGRGAEVEREVSRALALASYVGDAQPMDQAVAELAAHGQLAAARRVADATIEWIRRLPPGPDRTELERGIPSYLFGSGRSREARAGAEHDLETHPDDFAALELVGSIAADLGDTTSARRAIARLAAQCPVRGCDPNRLVSQAAISALLGERESAVRLLRDAFRGGFEWRGVLHIVRAFDGLRGYQPYDDLIRPAG